MNTTRTSEGKTSNRGSPLNFAGVTAAIKRLTRACCSDGHRLELRGPVVRVRAKGSEMVWRAETDRGTRWIRLDDGRGTSARWNRRSEEPRYPMTSGDMRDSITPVMAELKAELKQRQVEVDAAFAMLDGACERLDEMRDALVELVGVADADPDPSLDHRRGPKGAPVTWKGKTMSIWQWSQLTGIRANTIYLRLKRGWSAERALTEKEHEKSPPALLEDATSSEAVTAPPGAPQVPSAACENAQVGDLATAPPQTLPAAPPVSSESVPRQPILPMPKPIPAPGVRDPPEPKEPPEDPKTEDDEDDAGGAVAASDGDLKAEVARQQSGNKQHLVALGTTAVRRHVHSVRVDFFGDGNTQADGTGHVHRVKRFVVIGAHGHMHDLTVT